MFQRLPFQSVKALGAIAWLGVALRAHAATTLFGDRLSFDAAASWRGPVLEDSFESYAADVAAGARTLLLTGYRISYDLSGDVSEFGVRDTVDIVNGLGPTAGQKFLYAAFPSSAVPAGGAIVLVFDHAVQAFGIMVKDHEDGDLTFRLDTGDEGVALGALGNGAEHFFGVLSDLPFSSITLAQAGAGTGDGVAFDQLIAVQAVPEPGNWMLLLGGLGLFALRRRPV